MGTATATGFLQRALNALNRAARDYPDVVIDRDIGPRTLAALDGLLKARGKGGETVLLRAMEALRGERYIALAERRPSPEAFLSGWLPNPLGSGLRLAGRHWAEISTTERGGERKRGGRR